MHELAFAQSLVDIVEEEGRAQGFSRVRKVRVKVGALGHVEPDSLRFCFSVVSQGALAEGARLELDIVPGEAWCPRCDRNVSIAARYDFCPECGQGQLEMTAGDELRLSELEVE
ncbi:MAG: hydrogenase maturation nickel metallochaperone HypA [Methylocella sp.]